MSISQTWWREIENEKNRNQKQTRTPLRCFSGLQTLSTQFTAKCSTNYSSKKNEYAYNVHSMCKEVNEWWIVYRLHSAGKQGLSIVALGVSQMVILFKKAIKRNSISVVHEATCSNRNHCCHENRPPTRQTFEDIWICIYQYLFKMTILNNSAMLKICMCWGDVET